MENLTYYGRLWYFRATIRISQEEVASRAGITTSYYGQIERGEANPTVEILERICAAMEITVADLFNQADIDESDMDTISKQIVYFLSDKTDREKELALSLIKTAFKLKNSGKSEKNT
ncbi:MAG: helix-turn-helix domain-containing protein [Oscillospiraceae bacterium]|nr:helix-turn-helix domain-containing protein [Oscillospiraceae bacterium]